MNVSEIIPVECVLPSAGVRSKKRVLQLLAERLAQNTSLPPTAIFNKLIARERIGSTALGSGIAMPHARIQGLDRVVGVLIRLPSNINFEATGSQPVDLVLGLLLPENPSDEHHKLLQDLADALADPATLENLRIARETHQLHDALIDVMSSCGG